MIHPFFPGKSLLAFTLFFFLTSGYTFSSNNDRRILEASRTDTPPVIDGILHDSVWAQASTAEGFFQYEPHNDRQASQQTQVRVLYDDHAIYIAAKILDSNPDSILTELGLRDADDDLNADQFWVDINPFNDGINGFRFKVSASGVQSDLNMSGSGGGHSFGDRGWNAVWTSEVRINKEGWVVEMAIPYSALRFPQNDIHEWGINFWRELRRKRETSSWNYVNRRVGGNPIGFTGVLTGINGVTPPPRLSFFPYLSGYTQTDYAGPGWSNTFNGGMDVKYGINESFTLDMTLIPDFGQVQSDERVLNLSPFEVKYDENRQFFTEGTELYNKADLFYSRRIGTTPTGFRQARQKTSENELVMENPIETSMINATKLSGRTSSGLGIGFFNAMTAASHATIIDTLSGLQRKITTQPFSNYNLIVLDQSLPNNSSVSLINTNVAGSVPGYTANVTGTEFRLLDRSNMFRISGTAALSQQYFRDHENNFGHKYQFAIGKYGGNWQYGYSRSVVSDTYDQNDMGYLRRNNEVENRASVSYNIFDPFWRLLNISNSFSIEHSSLYQPNAFTGLELEYGMRALFDNRFFISFNTSYQPEGYRDYFEPRVPGRFYHRDKNLMMFVRYSSDYGKRLYVDGDFGYGTISNDYGQEAFSVEFAPTFRASDRFNISFEIEYQEINNDLGYVEHTNADSIFFGKRFTPTLENSLGSTYIFSRNLSLGINLRHYWSRVDYDGNYFLLKDNGSFQPVEDDLNISNINYNAFTIDMLLTWNFAPGSQLTAAWKNVIDSQGTQLHHGYFNNLNQTLQEPQINSLSIKLLYYLDYLMIRQLAGNSSRAGVINR